MIIDAHVHFYDPSRPEGVPWPDPNNSVLYRTVLPEHFRAIARPEGVDKVVVVEASTWVEDNRWILDLAHRDPIVAGFVGNLVPGSAEFASHLDRFGDDPIFRGIRARPLTPSMLDDGAFTKDLEKLAERELRFDIAAQGSPLRSVSALASRVPDLHIIINHVGNPRIDGNAPDPEWVKSMRRAAEHERVYCKVSGLVEATGKRPAPAHLDTYRATLDVLWDAFGEDRLIYASNWPVCENFSDYATVMALANTYFAEKGPVALAKVFGKNAVRAYGLST